jgi:hypothetical protein
MYSFIVIGLAVTIKMITVNLPLVTSNVTERESLKKTRTFLTGSKSTERQNMRDSDGTENSPIKPIADRQEQKQDGQHC